MSYNELIRINKLNFESKKVLIIGAGWMAQQYCNALYEMKIKDVIVISRKEESSRKCCEKYGYRPFFGGYEKVLPKLNGFDLVIIATPIHKLQAAATFAINCGNKNILIEKPGALYSSVLEKWASKIEDIDVRIRIAYNRYLYPSLWKLKELIEMEGSVSSCFYSFTEWIHTINFTNNPPEVYQRWGIANSLHVISMAHNIIGLPRQLCSYRSGSFLWHPSGSKFVGAGVTEKGILFSYHADWNSAGRWGIEVLTPKNSYRLMPLEKLYRCKKGSVKWEEVKLTSAYPQIKTGVAEEIAIMLHRDLERNVPLVTLKEAAVLAKLAENIFGYSSNK